MCGVRLGVAAYVGSSEEILLKAARLTDRETRQSFISWLASECLASYVSIDCYRK